MVEISYHVHYQMRTCISSTPFTVVTEPNSYSKVFAPEKTPAEARKESAGTVEFDLQTLYRERNEVSHTAEHCGSAGKGATIIAF